MAVWSRLLLETNQKLFRSNGLLRKLLPNNNGNTVNIQQGTVRCMSDHHVMEVCASRWQWYKTKDWMHFYFFVGAIPAALIIFCSNIFIGPATLEPIPEGYKPQLWEYYRSPISRFLAQHKVVKCIKNYNDYRYWSYKRYAFSGPGLERARMLVDKLRFN
ncbi:PREDICTED: uncharacterized protein LOC108579489 [Habropoda laboriosa]|uniref:uncharacterized protein LOC108579489 n=1 Tax=Habropoda laboriosa TaxID=597456 RepID=UPI00083E0428|nr:PREDICTED: uncharacterized protein LOC108579489 [Habropoda laboriosa]